MSVSNATLDMKLTGPAAPWAAPTGEVPVVPGFVPDCDWESRFSNVVDSICRDYKEQLPSFLEFTWNSPVS
mgnify:CR=1 FL=1